MMLSSLVYSLSQIFVEQIATEGFSTRLAYGLGFLALVAVVASLWFYVQLRSVQEKISENHSNLTEAQENQNKFHAVILYSWRPKLNVCCRQFWSSGEPN